MTIPRALIGGAVAALAVLTSGCAATQEPVEAPGWSIAELVAQVDAVATPQVRWTPCADQAVPDTECAAIEVPLDYTDPDGRQLALAVVRQPARDPERRIGTLFTAAGGPGGSGVDWAARGEMFPGELGDRFDVVTFDQRGIGGSSGVRCFPDSAAQQEFWGTLALPPTDDAQQRATEAASRQLAAGCQRHDGALIAHLTTVDAARDLELLRRAVGDRGLTYEGGSYASYLGTVYGTLFPDRVRALQLSSLLDPGSYTSDTLAGIHATAVGTEEVFGEFLRLCSGAQACAFGAGGASADELRARDTALLDRARSAAIPVGAEPESMSVGYGELVQAHAMLLYDPATGWPALAVLLAELERGAAGSPAVVREILSAVATTGDFLDAFVAISCADNTVPRSPDLWPEFAAESATSAPLFGPFWLYLRQPCAAWPAPAPGYPQRYPGPWTQHTAVPALLLNNRFDPATPLTSAQRAAEAMGSARLVVVSTATVMCRPATASPRSASVTSSTSNFGEPGTTCATGRTPFTD